MVAIADVVVVVVLADFAVAIADVVTADVDDDTTKGGIFILEPSAQCPCCFVFVFVVVLLDVSS